MASEGNKVSRLKVLDFMMIRDGAVPNKDARLTNCMMEDMNGSPQILKRPGYVLHTSTATSTTTGTGHGMSVLTNQVTGVQKSYAVIGSTLYFIEAL